MIELQIKKYFLEKYPEEACGILLNKKGVLTWIPCENIAEDKLVILKYLEKILHPYLYKEILKQLFIVTQIKVQNQVKQILILVNT